MNCTNPIPTNLLLSHLLLIVISGCLGRRGIQKKYMVNQELKSLLSLVDILIYLYPLYLFNPVRLLGR